MNRKQRKCTSGRYSFYLVVEIFLIVIILAGELKEKASEKIEEVKEQASEVAAEAKQQGEGKDSKVIKINYLIYIFIRLEVKQDVQEKASEKVDEAKEQVQGKYCPFKEKYFFNL